MESLIRLLQPLVSWNVRHPWTVLCTSLATALIAGFFAIQLKVDTDIASLLPDTNESVQALKTLQASVGGETPMQVAIRSESFETNVAFADDLVEESLKLWDEQRDRPYISRVEFRRETDILKDNALYLATDEELADIEQWLQEEIDVAREEANPFLVDFTDDFEDEESAEEESDGRDLADFRDTYIRIIPSEYPVNEDSTLMVLEMYPSGSQSDLSYLEDLFVAYDGLIEELNPASYSPHLEVQFGGRLKRHLNEFESIMSDVFSSFATGFSSVLLLLIFYFAVKTYIHYRKAEDKDQKHGIFSHLIRAPLPLLVIGVPLLISLAWTFGIAYGVLGTLNTMTSVLFVILFGLGIDYGIHFYARYIELRSSGMEVTSALLEAYKRTGSAILVSALTTAMALYVLIVADFRGFSEFGFISGTGILLALVAMLFLLPSLLVLFERWNWILLTRVSPKRRMRVRVRHFPYARGILVSTIVLSGWILWNTPDLRFEYEFSNLEPVFEEYEAFREFSRGVDESDRRNPAYLITENREDLFEVIDSLKARQKADPESMILAVESFHERFPMEESRIDEKLMTIDRIRGLLNHSFIRDQESEDLDLLRRAAQTRDPLELEDIPSYVLNRFLDRSGEPGLFVVVYPDEGLSDGRRSIAFKEEIGEVTTSSGRVYHAGSTSIVAAEMLDLMIEESPFMVGATLLIVVLFMFYSFRSVRWAMIALVPLLVGFLSLFGWMLVFGLTFNFYNLVVLPAILGIGCDNGVHIASRYREEGRSQMWEVLLSTGQHISMGSLTTMLGFAGLLFTDHPGLQSIGVMAVLGIGMTLLTALTLLPALVQYLESRGHLRYGNRLS
ncbi:MAG: MMPL family transporter [Balneolaceae bacterium]